MRRCERWSQPNSRPLLLKVAGKVKGDGKDDHTIDSQTDSASQDDFDDDDVPLHDDNSTYEDDDKNVDGGSEDCDMVQWVASETSQTRATVNLGFSVSKIFYGRIILHNKLLET